MRGRKRRLVPREKNGRAHRKLVPTIPAEPADAVGIAARVRHYGCDGKTASDMVMGTVAGRLRVVGILTTEQYQAALRYGEIRARYLRTIEAPDQPRIPPDDARSSGGCNCVAGCYDPESTGCRAKHARLAAEAWDGVTALLAKLMIATGDPCVVESMRVVVERDQWAEHMLPGLRMALSALDKHFREGQRRAA